MSAPMLRHLSHQENRGCILAATGALHAVTDHAENFQHSATGPTLASGKRSDGHISEFVLSQLRAKKKI